jgi:serine/threonine protein kinase
MSKDRPLPLPSNCVVSGYRIVRRLAEGGFGMVYLVTDETGQAYALKEYLPASLVYRHVGQLEPVIRPGKEALYRLGMRSFFEEGRALAQISHPAVVKVQNFFQENATVYMLMELLSGHTLQEFILTARNRRKGRIFREGTIQSLFDDLLSGLRYVHQKKMLHLDIKPANIFISLDDKPVFIDFGAAREVLEKEGRFIRPMYTPGFAAPEMYDRTSSFGPWTDIYAIGACLYSCMTGYPPQDVPKRREQDKLPQALERLRSDYSKGLLELVSWCLNLDAMKRPQSVHVVQKHLFQDVR